MDQTQPLQPLRVAVIGAGMAGILTAIKLTERGIDFAIYEKADRVGGTWRENTYPGLSCDVPSHSYTYSFARNPEWTQWFPPGPEIQTYFEKVADDYRVTPLIRFGDEVTSLEFNDGKWDLVTAAGHTDRVDVVIAATGVLHHPNIPTFTGLETFTGASFHTARWDHSVPLDGKRVGVIGTGSTAVQITSALIDRVDQFVLFQRTAQWVYPGEIRKFTDDEKAAFRNDPQRLEALIASMNKGMIDNVASAVIDVNSPQFHRIEQGCQDNLDRVVDPVLRAKLTPPYRAACKRLIFSEDFYDAIQRPNATVITAGIDRIEPTGVRTLDGKLTELDVLVLATGFRADRFVRPMRVIGEGGATSTRCGQKDPLPTCRLPCLGSLTCSCSTAPMVQSATSRSSGWPRCNSRTSCNSWSPCAKAVTARSHPRWRPPRSSRSRGAPQQREPCG